MASHNMQELLKISACIIFTKVPWAKASHMAKSRFKGGWGEIDSISWWESSKDFVAVFATDCKV